MPGTVVSDRDSSFLLTIADPTFFFWLDLDVGFEFDHATAFAFVNQQTGTLATIPSFNWPRINGIEQTEMTNGNASLDRFHAAYDTSGVVFEFEPVPVGDPTSWAIVLVGRNLTGLTEKTARKNDVKRIQEAINSAPLGPKVPKDNIKVVSGTDYWGGTKAEVCDLLDTMTGCNKLYFFYVGHGVSGKMLSADSTGEKTVFFKYEDLAQKLLATGAAEVCVVIEACHSGSAIRDLSNAAVPGPSGKLRRLKGSVDTSSLLGFTTSRDPDGAPFIKGIHACMMDPRGDLNVDGKVKFVEALAWAMANDPTVAEDKPQSATLGDGRKVTFPAPTRREFKSSDDSGGELHYSVEGIYYKIIKGIGGKKDSLVCRQTVYVRNETGSEHIGTMEVEVYCKEKGGGTHVIKKFIPRLKRKKAGVVHKICLGDVPADCKDVKVRKVAGKPTALQPLAAEIAAGVILDHRTSDYSPGEPIFQEIEVTDPVGVSFATTLDSIPGWDMEVDPASFTTTALIDTEYVFVTGCMPDTATRGGTFCAALYNSAPDTASLRVEALLFGSLASPIGGGESYFHRALSSSTGISVTTGTARLVDTRLDLSGQTSCTVGNTGRLDLVRSAIRPDSGVVYTAAVSGEINWDSGSLVGPGGGLVMIQATGVMTGGGIVDAVGDGLTLVGDQSDLGVSFFLIDGSTGDGLVLDSTTQCRLDWMRVLGSGVNDVRMINNAEAELVDAEFNDGKVDVSNESTLIRSWSMGFLLLTSAEDPIPGVVIEVRDALGSLVAVDTTGASGLSNLFALEEYRRSGAVLTPHTPHSVTMSFAGMDTMFSIAADKTWVQDVIWNTAVSGHSPDPAPPVAARLDQNTPNPFTEKTTIRFNLSAAGPVRLTILDIQGREVARLMDGQYPAGEHEFLWTPDGIVAGIYWYRLEADQGVLVQKLVRLTGH